MHLGDFETTVLEIAVVCPECMRLHEKTVQNRGKELLPRSGFEWLGPKRWTVWKIVEDYTFTQGHLKSGDKVAVIALTDNAWANRYMNHPNVARPVKLEETDLYELEEQGCFSP
jgi:hypothetical protein